MKKYLIYKHTNKRNGKSYIGQTHYENPELRWYRGSNGSAYKSSPKFYNAILAEPDGFEGFTHEVLQKNIPESEVDKLERYYIALYDTINNGYTISSGGNDHTYNSAVIYQLDEYKNILAIYNSFTDAEDKTGIAGKNLVAACKGRLKSCGGFYWCYEQDYKNFVIKKSIKLHATIPVYQLDIDKNIISEYNTITEAAAAVNGNSSKISLCCSGKCCTAYGYYWCTKANYDYFTPQLPTSSPKPKAILQLDLNNNIVATFNSASEAATILGIKNLRSKICLCCCGKQKTAGGYIWKYKE